MLVSETARHSRNGWTAVLLPALAFGVIEEGVVAQSLFNPQASVM